MRVIIVEGVDRDIATVVGRFEARLGREVKQLWFQDFLNDQATNEMDVDDCRYVIVKTSIHRMIKTHPDRLFAGLIKLNKALNRRLIFGDYFIQILSKASGLSSLKRLVGSQYYEINQSKIDRDLDRVLDQIIS